MDWIVGELEELIELLGSCFERQALNEEIVGPKLYSEDDRPQREENDD